LIDKILQTVSETTVYAIYQNTFLKVESNFLYKINPAKKGIKVLYNDNDLSISIVFKTNLKILIDAIYEFKTLLAPHDSGHPNA